MYVGTPMECRYTLMCLGFSSANIPRELYGICDGFGSNDDTDKNKRKRDSDDVFDNDNNNKKERM